MFIAASRHCKRLAIVLAILIPVSGCACVSMKNDLARAKDSASEVRIFKKIATCPRPYAIEFYDSQERFIRMDELVPGYGNVDSINIEWLDIHEKAHYRLMDSKNLGLLLAK